MSRLSKLYRQFSNHIDDRQEFAELIKDFDHLLCLYGGAGETPPTVAIGLGLRAERPGGPLKPAIIMYVPEDELGDLALPQRTREGFPIYAEAVGRIFLDPPGHVEANEAFRAHYDAPPGGVSISPLNAGTGTLGCYLTRGSQTYVLSNRHVLDPDISGTTGLQVLQQSTGDGNKSKVGMAQTSYVVPLTKSGYNVADAAVAALTVGDAYNAKMLVGPNGDDLRALVAPVTTVRAKDVVHKSGRTSGLTEAAVDGVHVRVPVPFPDGNTYTFDDCMTVKFGTTPFQVGGDSGALLVTAGNQPAGLLFAASTTMAYAFPLQSVLDALKAAAGGGKDFTVAYR